MDNPFDDLRKQLDGNPLPRHLDDFEKRLLMYQQYDQMVLTVLEQLRAAIFAHLHVNDKCYRSHYIVRKDLRYWAISLELKTGTRDYRQWEDYVVVRLEFSGPIYHPIPDHFSCYRHFGGTSATSTGLTAEALIEALKRCI